MKNTGIGKGVCTGVVSYDRAGRSIICNAACVRFARFRTLTARHGNPQSRLIGAVITEITEVTHITEVFAFYNIIKNIKYKI